MSQIRRVVERAATSYRLQGFWGLVKTASIYLLNQCRILPFARRARFYVLSYPKGVKLYRGGAANSQIKVLYVDTLSEPQARSNVNGMIKAYRKVSILMTFDYRKLARWCGQSRMNETLVQTAIDFEPDLIHLGKSELIYGSTIKEIKGKINTCVIHFYGDFRWGIQPWVVDIGKYADYTLFYHKEPSLIKQYEDLGIKNIGFWWVGTDPDIFYPRGGDKIFDVAFMANNSDFLEGHKLRRELIAAIAKEGMELHIFGSGWEYLSDMPNVHIHPFVNDEEFAKVCSASKITLGINAVNNVRMYASWRRTFNSMASGVFHLTHYVPGLEDVFENRKHLVWFNSIAEAIKLIEYYLAHSEEREKIARAGRQEILVHHTWDLRIAEMVKKIWDIEKGDEPHACNYGITVSVIIPTYNRGSIIERSVMSVLRQGLINFELIIVDGASTDNTHQIVKSFNDNRIRYIRREINHLQQYKETGLLDNPRNDGLKIARGKYISYLDSDDMYRSSFLKVMGEYLDKNPDVGLVYCDSIWHRNLDGRKEVADCDRSIDFDKELLKRRNIIGILEVMHRKEVAEKVGFFRPQGVRVKRPSTPYIGIEDWDYWFRASEHFKIKHLPIILADKVHNTSDFYSDKNFDPEVLGSQLVANDLEDYAHRWNLISRYYNYILQDVYPQKSNIFHEKATEEVLKWIPRGIINIVDIGCGDGYALKRFKELNKKAIGLTMSDEDMLQCAINNVHAVKGDMNFIPFDNNKFDLVFARHVIEHSPMPLFTLFEFNRVLVSQGFLVLVSPIPDRAFIIDHQNHYSPLPDSLWRKLFRDSKFKVLKYKTARCGGHMEYRYLLLKIGEILTEDIPNKKEA